MRWRALAAVILGASLVGCGTVASPAPSGGASSAPTVEPTVSTPPWSPADTVGLGRDWGVIPDGGALAAIGIPTSLVAGPSSLVATGVSGVAWSADGREWAPVTGGPVGLPVAATPGGYFALGEGTAWSSADGRAWSSTPAPSSEGYEVIGIAAAGTSLVAIGHAREPDGTEGSSAAWVSTDGWTWSRSDHPFARLEHVAAAGDVVVMVATPAEGPSSVYAGRPSGPWTIVETPFRPAKRVTAIAARPDGGFIAVGHDGEEAAARLVVWLVPDPFVWREVETGTIDVGSGPLAVAATGGTFVVTSHVGPRIWRSSDARSWTPVEAVPSLELGAPTFAVATADRLVALGVGAMLSVPTLAWTSPAIVPEPAPAGSWEVAGRLPTKVSGQPLVALSDGSLVLFGGLTGTGLQMTSTRDVWRRDPSGVWRAVAPMPSLRSVDSAVVTPDGRVWLVGGDVLATSEIASVDIYDPTTDRWSAGPPLPSDRRLMSAVATSDGAVAALAQVDAGRIEMWLLGRGEATWRMAAAWSWMEAYGLREAALPGGRLLVLGLDVVGEGDPRRFEPHAVVVDPASGSVVPAPTPPHAVVGQPVALADGRIALVGQAVVAYGAGGGIALRRVDVFDETAARWEYLTSLPVPRVGAGITLAADGRMYVAGGAPEIVDVGPVEPTDTLYRWSP